MQDTKTIIQKFVLYLYTNSKLSEREIKKTMLLTIASKRIKYLEIKLTREVKDLYTENCNTLIKELEDINKWKDITQSCNGRINIVTILILPKAIYGPGWCSSVD